jgi:hypothetical protein
VRRTAGRVGAIVSIWSPCQAGLSWSRRAEVALRGQPRGRSGQLLTLDVPVAGQILLQVACGNIGQLTDFEAPGRRRPGHWRTAGGARRGQVHAAGGSRRGQVHTPAGHGAGGYTPPAVRRASMTATSSWEPDQATARRIPRPPRRPCAPWQRRRRTGAARRRAPPRTDSTRLAWSLIGPSGPSRRPGRGLRTVSWWISAGLRCGRTAVDASMARIAVSQTARTQG